MLEYITEQSPEFDAARIEAFKSCSGEFGMPQLRSDMIYTGMPKNVYAGDSIDTYTNEGDLLVLYGQTANVDAMRGNLLGFFVDDAKFGSTWYKMSKFVDKLQNEIMAEACLLPNYSLWRDDPLPEQQYNWYKTMLVGRIWQEMGIVVAPVLNWGSPESYRFAYHGIPKDLPIVWCQCRNTLRGEEKYFIDGLVAMHKELNFGKVVIYGGYENPKLMSMIPSDIKVVPFMSWNSKKRRIQKNMGHGKDGVDIYEGHKQRKRLP